MSIRLLGLSGLAGLLSSGVALADVPQVAADIVPVHGLVAKVMEGVGEPELIIRQGASPHGYSMRPSDARGVQEADAIFWIGPELAPWMEDAIASLAPDAEVVELLEVDGTKTLEFRTGATFAPHDHGNHEGHDPGDGPAHEEHAPETGHDHAEDDHAGQDHAGHAQAGGEHGHSHEGLDPHAWLDPENARVWLDAIAATLSDLDPENAETYASNAEAGKAEIDAAAGQAAATLEPATDLRFVVFHDAYQYYETRFELSTVGAIELSDASDPSPARIEEVRDTVRDLEVSCIFFEPQFNQALVQTVAEGADVQTGTIDPVGTDIAPGPDFYPQLITTIAEEIASCADGAR